MGTFVIGEVGEYIPQNVQENEFLNARLESDMYGIYYSVKFEGDAETFLIQAKKPPVEGQPEWGMIEQSKSGKSMRFKRVKREDGGSTSNGSKSTLDYEPSTNTRWAIGMAYRAFIQVTGSIDSSSGEFPFDVVKQHASALLRMFDELKSGSVGSVPPTPPIQDQTTLPQGQSSATTRSPIDTQRSLGDEFREKTAVNHTDNLDEPPHYDDEDIRSMFDK